MHSSLIQVLSCGSLRLKCTGQCITLTIELHIWWASEIRLCQCCTNLSQLLYLGLYDQIGHAYDEVLKFMTIG